MGISREPQSEHGQQARGQTTLDFVIGISVFLAVLLFIFLFLPGILSPFTTSAQAETVSSNRVADQLASGTLAKPDDPYVLDRYCTVEFFDGAAPSQCTYESGDLNQQVGVASANQNLNVSLRGNISTDGDGDDLLCWDNSGDQRGIVEETNTECGVRFTRGDSTPETIPSVTSVRVVSLDGRDASLYVEMW